MSRRSIAAVWLAAMISAIATTGAIAAAGADDRAPDLDLAGFASAIERLVEDETFLGAEVLVVHADEPVLHRAWGWKDREAGERLEPGTIYSIRSMTKPIAGTVVQQLVDEGRLGLDDRLADHLPAFDRPGRDAITIRHLLTHHSGYPQSDGVVDWTDPRFESVGDLVEQWASRPPDVAPGTRFIYADANADILAAVVERVTGRDPAEAMRRRVLEPLGMTDTITLLAPNDPRAGRIASAYRGSKGAWTRCWRPEDGPHFRYPMYAQSLYSSCADYARFMRLWLDQGATPDGTRLLSKAACARALTPVPTGAPAPHPDLAFGWGHMWGLLHVADGPRAGELLAFGHGGSDGTLALASPALDLVVVFCSQSRGASGDPVAGAMLEHLLLPGLEAGRREAGAPR